MRKSSLIISCLLFVFMAGSQAQVVLQRCDRTNLWSGSNLLTVDNTDKKEGVAALQFTGRGTDWFKKTFSQTYTGVDESGFLSLWLYVSDEGNFNGEGSIEISSSGGPDEDEYSWSMASLDIGSGWNELVLPIASAIRLGAPDLNAINFFRVYQNLSDSVNAKIDDIRFLESNVSIGSGDPLDIQPLDFNSLDGKVMFGYQGWFLHPKDGSAYAKWRHWGRDNNFSPDKITVDMFPDFREYEADELYPTGGFTYADGRPAKVYSAYTKKTVVRHMKWLRDYGLDGVFLQRFVTNVTGDVQLRRSRDTVTTNIMEGCEKYGRAFVNMWDLSSFDPGRMDLIINDWKHLVDDLKITESPNYLHHRGKPLLAIWGFSVREEFPESDLQALLDFFKGENTPEKYRATVMLGVDHDFHQRSNWLDEMAQADVISPWSVGRFSDDAGQQNFMNTHVLPAQDWCDRNNVDFLPVIWPGFSWHNLKGDTKNKRPRRGGNFYWTQANRVISGNAKSVYIAMFDEVDESTAMYKLAENDTQTPDQGYFLTLDADGYDLPSDWYLRCAKLTTEVVRGNTNNRTSLGTPQDGIDNFAAVSIAARCGADNGKLKLHYPASSAGSLYEFSIDGGLSYPFTSPEGTSEMTVDGLSAGIYNVWVRNEDNTFPTDLGPHTIFDAEPFATVAGVNTTCDKSGGIDFLVNDLPYAGEIQISVDSGISYDFTSSQGIWRDTIFDLPVGEYPVWIRYDDETCPTELSTITLINNLLPVEVYPMLDGDQSAPSTDTLYACPGSSLLLFCSPVDPDFVWTITGPNGFSADSRTVQIASALTPEMFGTYEISYIRQDACVSGKSFVLLQNEDCKTNADNSSLPQNSVQVYPNPANENIVIETSQTRSVHLEILSLDGRIVMEESHIQTPVAISLEELKQGTYLLKLNSDGGTLCTRFIKQ